MGKSNVFLRNPCWAARLTNFFEVQIWKQTAGFRRRAIWGTSLRASLQHRISDALRQRGKPQPSGARLQWFGRFDVQKERLNCHYRWQSRSQPQAPLRSEQSCNPIGVREMLFSDRSGHQSIWVSSCNTYSLDDFCLVVRPCCLFRHVGQPFWKIVLNKIQWNSYSILLLVVCLYTLQLRQA